MIKEYVKFLKEFNVIALAVAFVMGTASTALVNSLVKDIIMPLVSPLLSAGAWREAALTIGPISMKYGAFLAELINFLILGAVIFFIAKKVLKIEVEAKK